MKSVGRTRFAAGMLLVAALLCAAVLSHYAATTPDGLESVAERLGFAASATDPVWRHALFPDYEGGGIFSAGSARVLGTLLVLAVMVLLTRVAGRGRRR